MLPPISIKGPGTPCRSSKHKLNGTDSSLRSSTKVREQPPYALLCRADSDCAAVHIPRQDSRALLLTFFKFFLVFWTLFQYLKPGS